MPPSSPRVLIIRLDAIGDALAVVPLLGALKARAIPVDIVLSRANSDAISSGAYTNRFIGVDDPELSADTYSHILIATEEATAYKLAQSLRAPHRIGFYNGWGKPLKSLWLRSLLTEPHYRSAGLDPKTQHEVEVLFALGRSLLEEHARPSRNVEELTSLVIEEPILADDRVAFQITDKWERLGMAFDQVLDLAQRCSDIAPIHWIAGSHERDYAQRFAAAIGCEMTSFTSIIPWKATIAASRALVAPDSGAIHVAGMTGVPTVAVFAPQKHFTAQITRWAPWAAPHAIIEATHHWSAAGAEALTNLLSAPKQRNDTR